MSEENYRQWIAWLARRRRKMPTLAIHRACLYLSRHGEQFLVDFGVDNAVEKARAMRRIEKVTR